MNCLFLRWNAMRNIKKKKKSGSKELRTNIIIGVLTESFEEMVSFGEKCRREKSN